MKRARLPRMTILRVGNPGFYPIFPRFFGNESILVFYYTGKNGQEGVSGSNLIGVHFQSIIRKKVRFWTAI